MGEGELEFNMSKYRRKGDKVCSFCGKKGSYNNLIDGPPGVAICLDCLELCNVMSESDRRRSQRTSKKDYLPKSLPIPIEIKKRLDEYIIGQDRTKKILSVAVNSHYKRILNPIPANDVELEKTNILLMGPTGCGKTLLARTLAKILDVPFAISDATTLTEAGYVGEDVENVLLRLVQAANFDLKKAAIGIIYIDEIDKIGRTHDNPSITRDVSGEGVQQALLKILEGTVVNVPPQGGRKHPEQEYLHIDTTHILFIGAGTFSGVEHIIGRRIGRKQIGFDAETRDLDELGLGEILEQVQPEDLMEYGLIPEFIGRFPVQCVVHPLDVKALAKILTEPKNAVIRQYQEFFRMENASLEFTPKALDALAKKALEKKTGARALRAIIEELMLDTMFQLPSERQSRRYTITDKMVRGEKPIEPKFIKKSLPADQPRVAKEPA